MIEVVKWLGAIGGAALFFGWLGKQLWETFLKDWVQARFRAKAQAIDEAGKYGQWLEKILAHCIVHVSLDEAKVHHEERWLHLAEADDIVEFWDVKDKPRFRHITLTELAFRRKGLLGYQLDRGPTAKELRQSIRERPLKKHKREDDQALEKHFAEARRRDEEQAEKEALAVEEQKSPTPVKG
jgi:hypothetical protein